MGRLLSESRLRVRTALRVFEAESLHALDGKDLAIRAKVSLESLAHLVRADLNTGLLQMDGILLTLDQDGRTASDLWESAVKMNPYPMWWNCSRFFQDSIYRHLTFRRYQLSLGKFGLKQMKERGHKLSTVQKISMACPAIAEVLKPSKLALKTIAALPAQSEMEHIMKKADE